MCCTKRVRDLKKPTFGDIFTLPVPLSKLYTKTLQINVWSITDDNQEECLGCAQVSLADFNPQGVSQKWYNILSFKFLQTGEDGAAARPPADPQLIIKEESSDESTIISSQTSTLTRNQECEGFQSAINFKFLKLDELRNCINSDEEEASEEDEEECDDDKGIIVEFRPNEKLESDIPEEDKYSDKQTNTECAFYPEQAKQRKLAAAAGNVSGTNFIAEDRAIVIKRSQTFSPSAAVSKNHYICKLNRSDSDSSMPLYRRSGGPFQRNSAERRSLRFRKQLGSVTTLSSKQNMPTTARTSLDLELDLQAQHTRLYTLNSELGRLRELKQRLEVAKQQGDTELASWVLEDQQFQSLVAQAESDRLGKTPEEKKIDKMLRKTSNEIYKLRKSKVGNGKPDIISFK